MTPKFLRVLIFSAIAVLCLIRNDIWFWHTGSLVFGLPVTLSYHIAFCLASAAVLYWLVQKSWPQHLEVDETTEEEK